MLIALIFLIKFKGYILNGASSNSKNYLTSEFNDILNNVSSDKQKLIYKIAKVISEEN